MLNVKVLTKKGEGIITKIITKSTGYVEVTMNNGTIRKEMAFNLKTIDGAPLKKKPVKRSKASSPKSNLQELKSKLMWINSSQKGDRHGATMQLMDTIVNPIYAAAIEQGNSFIKDVIDSIMKYQTASEKQAYVIARFADQNGIKA